MAKKNLPYLNPEGQLVKKCTRCGIEKHLYDFYDYSRRKDKKVSICKECLRTYAKSYRDDMSEEQKADYKDYQKTYRAENKDEISEYLKNYAIENKSELRAYYIQYMAENREYLLAEKKKYYHASKDDYRDEKNRLARLRSRNNLEIRFKRNFSHRIREALKGNKDGKHWENIVGYSISELRNHIEKQFEPGMTWDNWSASGWHIDHIIPQSAFNFESYVDIDFKRCWCLDNLRPLWSTDNLSKGAKLDAPFQPSIAFGGVL